MHEGTTNSGLSSLEDNEIIINHNTVTLHFSRSLHYFPATDLIIVSTPEDGGGSTDGDSTV